MCLRIASTTGGDNLPSRYSQIIRIVALQVIGIASLPHFIACNPMPTVLCRETWFIYRLAKDLRHQEG
jgi:hypothetical protein